MTDGCESPVVGQLVFPGDFSPVHVGHLLMVQQALPAHVYLLSHLLRQHASCQPASNRRSHAGLKSMSLGKIFDRLMH